MAVKVTNITRQVSLKMAQRTTKNDTKELLKPSANLHVECPRCHHHTIVLQGESRYVCLNCRWTRDISSGQKSVPIGVLLAVAILLLVIVLGG